MGREYRLPIAIVRTDQRRRTNAGEVQNYFCDSAVIADELVGCRWQNARDQVQSALPSATREASAAIPPGRHVLRKGVPHIRVTFNVTPGSAERRVTLLVP